MFKKIIPAASTLLISGLLLTGCSPTGETKPADQSKQSTSSSSETEETKVDASAELLKALKTGEEKAKTDGYTESATDGRMSVIISYDNKTDRTLTSDSSGQSFYVSGYSNTTLSTLQGMIEQGQADVVKENNIFVLTMKEVEGVKMTVQVKDNIPTEITSENEGNAKWVGKLSYRVTEEAKKAFETAKEMTAEDLSAGQ